MMPYWTTYYFAYLTYGDESLDGLSGVQLVARAAQDAIPNIQTVTLTGTGAKFVELAALGPSTFHCAYDATCPEVLISGDPHATLGGSPAPFRGYGDPSLERDPDTGTLWLSYSWLDVLISSPGPPPVFDFGVRTHLARSDDNGATFSFLREVNQTVQIEHPDTSTQGWTIHEVSTMAREASGSWQNLWLTYFDPLGTRRLGRTIGPTSTTHARWRTRRWDLETSQRRGCGLTARRLPGASSITSAASPSSPTALS